MEVLSSSIINGELSALSTSWIVSNDHLWTIKMYLVSKNLRRVLVLPKQGVQDGNGDLVYYPGLDTYS
jgi:hypothetical protein